MAEPVLSEEITGGGVVELLPRIEELRTSGILLFEAGDTKGEIKVVAGQIAMDQDEQTDGSDPVETLLALREGRVDLYQQLPVLPVSKGNESRRNGSLAVHVPADLMNYCERVGLTGTLTLENERWAEVVYDKGELIAIHVDGTEDDDLSEVFAWEEGTFDVVATSTVPKLYDSVEDGEEEEDPADREPTQKWVRPRRPAEVSQSFLRVVEVALGSIVEERERRRSPSRSSPAMPPSPKTKRPDSVPKGEAASREAKDPQVRVIYLSASNEGRRDSSPATRHAAKGGHEGALPDAVPERRLSDPDLLPASEAKRTAGGPPTERVRADRSLEGKESDLKDTLTWAAVVLVTMLVVLAVIANLPSM